MAVPESQSFHQQTRDLLNSIALGGMKIDLQRGHRLTHPTFKGLPFNSTGSMNRMAFMTKAENDCPLEDKVRIAGGARTQKAQEFYQKKLKGVAEWVRNQQLMKEGLPPTPPNPEDLQLPLSESLHLELEQTLQALNDALQFGDLGAVTVSEFGKLPRLVIRYLGTVEDSTVAVDFFNDFNTMIGDTVFELAYPSLRSNENITDPSAKRAKKVLDNLVIPTGELIGEYAVFLQERWDGSDKARLLGLRAAIAKTLGNKRNLMKDASDAIYEWMNSLSSEGSPSAREQKYAEKAALVAPYSAEPPFLAQEPYIQVPKEPTRAPKKTLKELKEGPARARAAAAAPQ